MREARELTFTTQDGTELFYRHWPAVDRGVGVGGGDSRGLVLFHRGHEHSGRLQHLVDELDLPGLHCFAWDARGHGRSPGPRGHSPSVATSVRDADDFARHLAAAHGVAPENLAVLGQSVGAVLAAAWVHDYAPKVRCLVLASPAFAVKLYVPFARPGLRLWRALRGNFTVNSYVKSRFLTHDPERIRSFDADRLITRAISVDVLLGLYDAAERVVADAQAIRVPTQLLVSGEDWVVEQGPQFDFFARLGAAAKECHVLPGFFHDTLGELHRAKAIGRARAFLRSRFEAPTEAPDLLGADEEGYTRDEYDALAAPVPRGTPKRAYFAATRAALALGARLSEGLRLGRKTGFDSGSTLDYVYRNEARGRWGIGRWIDRAYLESIGWRGIRVRKAHVEELLGRAMQALRDRGRPVRLLDVAAGHGRYVLDAVAAAGVAVEDLLLRDFDEGNVAAGRRLLAERGLGGVGRFERGDAFDRASLAAVSPRRTLAVVSGLYELFPGNREVRDSLAGLAEAVEPGGYLVYTGQPWHPQLEFIARALSSHRGGKPWVMRRRTQAELDQLVESAGFAKEVQLVDDWGIFTVSLARRAGPA